MKASRFTLIAFCIISLTAESRAFSQYSQDESDDAKWQFPANVDQMVNPEANSPTAVQDGKANYEKLCYVCHGLKGKGDGVAAAGLPVRPADHTSAAVQDQSDGRLFWELSNGHTPMPAYENVLSEKERWDLIAYIRTLDARKKK